jgi:hypothetical protein
MEIRTWSSIWYMLVISQFETQLNTIENPEISPTQKQNRTRLQELPSRTEIGWSNLMLQNRSKQRNLMLHHGWFLSKQNRKEIWCLHFWDGSILVWDFRFCELGFMIGNNSMNTVWRKKIRVTCFQFWEFKLMVRFKRFGSVINGSVHS